MEKIEIKSSGIGRNKTSILKEGKLDRRGGGRRIYGLRGKKQELYCLFLSVSQEIGSSTQHEGEVKDWKV
jgi:hypothetical protein